MKKLLKKNFAGIPLYQPLLVLFVSLLLIIIGSVADWKISSSIANVNSSIGKAVALIGALPFYVLVGSSGSLFFISLKHSHNKFQKVLGWVVLFLAPVACGALYGYDDLSDFMTSKALSILVGIGLVGAFDFLLYFFYKDADRKEARKAGMLFLFGGAFVFLLILLLKTTGCRPRYYWANLQSDPYLYFRNWWQIDKSIKNSAVAAGVESSAFQSWPSGHSAFAAATVMMVFLPRLNRKIENRETVFFIVAFVYALLVGFGRLLYGRHYLSDIGFGFLFSYVFVAVFIFLVYRKEKGNDEAEQTSGN